MTIRYDRPPEPPTGPTPPRPGPPPTSNRKGRAGHIVGITGGVVLAFLVGVGVGNGGEATVQAQPAAQQAPVLTTRTVEVPGPTVTVQAPAPAPRTVTAAPRTVTEAPVAATEASTPGGSFTAGTYEVGTEIQPGTYRTSGSDYCYWARLNGVDGELASINANGFAKGPGSVTVKSSDEYLEFSGDCTWTKK